MYKNVSLPETSGGRQSTNKAETQKAGAFGALSMIKTISCTHHVAHIHNIAAATMFTLTEKKGFLIINGHHVRCMYQNRRCGNANDVSFVAISVTDFYMTHED